MTLGKMTSQQDLIDLFYRMGGLSTAIEQVLQAGSVPPDTTFAIQQLAFTLHDISSFLVDEAETGGVSFVPERDK
jgi:hypothetical protein